LKIESYETKINDDMQKMIDHAINKDELTQEMKKSVVILILYS